MKKNSSLKTMVCVLVGILVSVGIGKTIENIYLGITVGIALASVIWFGWKPGK